MADSEFMTTSEVAAALGVDPKTVARYAKTGLLPSSHRTPGGHRRWRREEVVKVTSIPADLPR